MKAFGYVMLLLFGLVALVGAVDAIMDNRQDDEIARLRRNGL